MKIFGSGFDVTILGIKFRVSFSTKQDEELKDGN